MYETSATFRITNQDGTTVQFNDGGPFVLESVTGFDSPNVRQNIDDLPEMDGALAGDFFFGSRPVTLNGKVIASSAAYRNTLMVQLQRALRGLRGDLTIVSQAQGLPAMKTTARLDNVRWSGGYVKDFQIALICPDPRLYSENVNEQTSTAAGPTSGASFPLVFPVAFGGGTGGTANLTVSNAGNIDSAPVIRLTGPLTEPRVVNATTGESLWLDNVSLGAGEYLDIDVWERTVVSSTGANWYAKVRFPDSVWWTLQPGANFIQLWTGSSSSGVSVRVTFNDAWA